MKQIVTQAIVLSRTDYGEADRILTLLTPDEGKLSLLAKGVRRIKSKLAGGIELFSVSTITFIRGRGEVGTLVSARLDRHYKHIVEDLDRTMLGYELTKLLHKNTEDEPESTYFTLLQQAFATLDDVAISVAVIDFWFTAQLLKLAGHAPNLQTDSTGNKLRTADSYDFTFEHMAFSPASHGRFRADHIKFLRLCFAVDDPKVLAQVQGSDALIVALTPLMRTMRTTYLRV